MPVSRRIRLLVPAASLLGIVAIACASLFAFHMGQVLRGATGQVKAAHAIAFRFGSFRPEATSGFTPLAAPANLRAGAVLDGRIYLSGPGELVSLDASGAPLRVWRSGSELPGTVIGQMSAVRLRGMAQTQLAVATADAGVLFLSGEGDVAQLLPSDPKLRDVTALAALSDGELLLGTRTGGVLNFDGETLAAYRPELARIAITTLLVRDGGLWIGTQNDGVYLVEGGVTRHFLEELPDSHVESMTAGAGRVFAGTPDGVAEFQDGQRVRILGKGVFAHALLVSGQTLTIAALEGGTVDVPLGAGQRTPTPSAVPESSGGGTQQFISLPGSGGGTGEALAIRTDGLYRRRGASWTRAVAPQAASLADANISALAFAPDGQLWIGYFDRGLDVLNMATGRAQHLESDHLFCINRIARDPRRETMAVATANGLVLFDRGGTPRQVMTRRDGLISEYVTDVAFDHDTMTVATPAGLSFVGPGGVESLYAFEGLVNNHVYALAIAPDTDEVVAGTLGGVSMLTHGVVRRNVTAANSALRHNWITAVLPSPDFAGGGYLLGTYGGGLMRMNAAGAIEPMPGAARDGIINPNALLATETHVFAGSMGSGLWMYGRQSRQWQQITVGLPSLNVTALAARGGELYVGTENGLVHIPEARLPA